MKKINLGQVINILANVGVIAGLMFVGIQLRQDRNIAESNLLASDQVMELEFARLAGENAGTWRTGLAGEPLTEEQEVTFDLLAYTQFRMNANRQRRAIVFEGETVGGELEEVARPYAFFLYENPGLRAWFSQMVEARSYIDRAYSLPDELRFFPADVSEALRLLDQAQPELPARRFYPY